MNTQKDIDKAIWIEADDVSKMACYPIFKKKIGNKPMKTFNLTRKCKLKTIQHVGYNICKEQKNLQCLVL